MKYLQVKRKITLTESDVRRMVTTVIRDVLSEKKAYHGGHADFDRFDLSYINTGEGAQAYGYGVYVTEAKSVGEHYVKVAYWTNLKKKFGELAANFDNILVSKNLAGYTQLNPWWIVYKYFKKNKDVKELETKLKQTIAELKSKTDFTQPEQQYGNGDLLDYIYNLINTTLAKISEYFGDYSTIGIDSLKDFIENKSVNDVKNLSKNLIMLFVSEYEKVLSLVDSGDITPELITVGNVKFGKYLYTVIIPDDNGSNYIKWQDRLSVYSKIIQKSENTEFVSVLKQMNRNSLIGDFIRASERVISAKETSEEFAKLGFDGNKVPIAYTTGGDGRYGYNYIVYNDHNVKIIKKEILYKV